METLNKMKLFNSKITAFGHGSMGGAIINSLLEKKIIDINKYQTIVRTAKSRDILKQAGINSTTERVAEDIENSDIVFLSYKQEGFRAEQVYENMQGKIIISLIAGISTEELAEKFPGAKVVRAMPNRGSVVGEGCTFLKFSRDFTEEEKDLVKDLFDESGDVYEVETRQDIDKGTILSASMVGVIAFFRDKIYNTLQISEDALKSREFFVKFTEIVENLAKKYDFLTEDAHKIAEKTFQAVEKLHHQSGETVKNEYSSIQASVTSKNGTTQAMIEYLESINIEKFLAEVFAAERILADEKEEKFAEFLEQACEDGLKRAEELAKGE